MKRFLLGGIAASALLVAACSDADGARRALAQQGYTDIQITGFSAFSCGNGDTYSTGFRAVSIAGKPVEGVVCSGWMKGATIRTF